MATYTSIHTGGAIDSGITLTDQITGQNALINGGMTVAQRGTSFTSTTPANTNSDDTYMLDRWLLLSDGNDIVDVSQATDAPTGALNSIGLDIETVNKKFGILQIIEQKNAIDIIGGVASLSFQAKVTGSSLSNIKAAVLSWDSTADAITSDIVSAWGADGVTPTWATNWTAENTPANLSVTTAWAEYKLENISIDTASATNIAVFIWCDDLTTTLGDFLYLTNIKLEKGAVATPFVGREPGKELALCQRYFEKSYAQGIAPGTATSNGIASISVGNTSTSQLAMVIFLKIVKRTTPSLTYYDNAGATSKVNRGSSSVDGFVDWIGDASFRFGSNDTTSTNRITAHWTANAEL